MTELEEVKIDLKWLYTLLGEGSEHRGQFIAEQSALHHRRMEKAELRAKDLEETFRHSYNGIPKEPCKDCGYSMEDTVHYPMVEVEV